MIGKRNQDGETDSKEATNSQVEKGLTGKARGDSGEDGGKQTLKIGLACLALSNQPQANRNAVVTLACATLLQLRNRQTGQAQGIGHRDPV